MCSGRVPGLIGGNRKSSATAASPLYFYSSDAVIMGHFLLYLTQLREALKIAGP